MVGNVVRLHRVICAPPELVFRAFTEADALAKWLPPDGFTADVAHLEAKVGGTFAMSFRHFASGHVHSFGGEYLEVIPGQLLRYTDVFDDPNLPGVIHVTITFTKVSVGTQIHIEQSGLPEVIPVEQCYLGWQQSLRNLAQFLGPQGASC